ncbi:MAG: dehypoxanthine futalosine cyclase, partial [Blastocatellia bacterium]|nr:dehypoxanthine futalosine cyclase [Blastocatellia bacterium]
MSQIRASERISPELAVEIITEMPSEELFLLADEVRRKYHPDNVVTYVVDRNINYSNICTSVCTFCAFYRKPGSAEGYVLSY